MNALDAVFQRQAVRRHFSRAAGTYLAAAALQKEVEGKVNSILTEEQRKQLEEMRNRGPQRRPNAS